MRLPLVLILMLLTGSLLALDASAVVGLVSPQRYREAIQERIPTGPDANRGFTDADPGQPTADHRATRELLEAHFARHGWSVDTQELEITGLQAVEGAANIVATRIGSQRPDEIYILCAHYDSANNPGYDDNASGVAAVMEAAVALSFVQTEATIQLIAFDAEELGLKGAHRFAAAAVEAGTDIRGVLNLDMIGYNHEDGDTAWVGHIGGADSVSEDLRQEVATAVSTYSDLNVVTGVLDGSDHAAFDVPGYRAFPAVQLTEERNPADSNRPFNPDYHRPEDHKDGNAVDIDFAVAITKAAIGWLCDAAVLSDRVNPPVQWEIVAQPIKVARSAGSDVVNEDEILFEDFDDAIFAQAGIDLRYLPFRRIDQSSIWQLDNTCDPGEVPDPRTEGVDGEELLCLWELATSDISAHHDDANVLNVWFVRAGTGGGYGAAVIGGNGMMIPAKTIADPNHFPDNEPRRDTMAHEYGHNLGLLHPEDDPESLASESEDEALMLSGTRTVPTALTDVYHPQDHPEGVSRLSLRQIARILESPFVRPIPSELSYRSIANRIAKGGVHLPIEASITPAATAEDIADQGVRFSGLDRNRRYRISFTVVDGDG